MKRKKHKSSAAEAHSAATAQATPKDDIVVVPGLRFIAVGKANNTYEVTGIRNDFAEIRRESDGLRTKVMLSYLKNVLIAKVLD
jgi:hypothetical protein